MPFTYIFIHPFNEENALSRCVFFTNVYLCYRTRRYHDEKEFRSKTIFISPALFQRYVPADAFAGLFGEENEGFGLLLAATIGVPLYACGGGTVPLLQQWLAFGMSMGQRHFVMYLGFVILFSLVTGAVVNLVV